jgi:TRAP-type mannitol/chloroaromatic compound transport system permease small subunit
MPSLSFVMPHWLYWSGLLLFPAIAIYLIRHQERHGVPQGPSLFIAYLFWLCSGFLGLHRFYLRNIWGILFIPVFFGILYCNDVIRDLREDESRTLAAVQSARKDVDIARPPAENATAEDNERFRKAQAELQKVEPEHAKADAELAHWRSISHYAAALLGAMLLVDAVLLPGVTRKRRAVEASRRPVEPVAPPPPDVPLAGTAEDPTLRVHTRFTDAIEWVNVRAGEYVAYWAIISVFVYYYEVIARFFFNSPTNWVHESMFLMFGMQYMLSGAYAYKEDQHVRVDVIYAMFSPRGKAIADIITSVFFFIFVGTMLVTGARFAMDSISFDEHSFTEWGVQYWPVKLMIPLGAGLLLLQGVSKLIKDIVIVRRGA